MYTICAHSHSVSELPKSSLLCITDRNSYGILLLALCDVVVICHLNMGMAQVLAAASPTSCGAGLSCVDAVRCVSQLGSLSRLLFLPHHSQEIVCLPSLHKSCPQIRGLCLFYAGRIQGTAHGPKNPHFCQQDQDCALHPSKHI